MNVCWFVAKPLFPSLHLSNFVEVLLFASIRWFDALHNKVRPYHHRLPYPHC